MKISLLNPNSSRAVSNSMAELIAGMPEVADYEVTVATLDAAPIGIESHEDIALVTPMVVDFVAITEADAHVVGCFSDPGVAPSRKVTNASVIGIGEAAYREAANFDAAYREAGKWAEGAAARPFGVVSLGPQSIERHRDAIKAFGLTEHLVDDLPLHMSVADAHSGEMALAKIASLGKALTDRGAEALVLACAGMGHHCAKLEALIGCPVIDPVQAGVRAAIASLRGAHAPSSQTTTPHFALK